MAGYLAERQGLETLGPCMVISLLAMVLLHEVIVRRQPVHARQGDTRQDLTEVVGGEA